MVKSFKTNILTWLKTKTYIKTEIDKLLQLKSNIGHTHTNASTTTPGFLSAEDKTKLNNLKQITVDSTINATSTNPVQNKVINTALTAVESTVNNVYENYTKNSMRIKIGRWSDNAGEDNTGLKVNYKSDGIYAKLYCDKSDFNYTDKEVVLVINGVPYIRKINETGKSERLAIQLERGTFILTAFIRGYEGLNPATDMKIIKVI